MEENIVGHYCYFYQKVSAKLSFSSLRTERNKQVALVCDVRWRFSA